MRGITGENARAVSFSYHIKRDNVEAKSKTSASDISILRAAALSVCFCAFLIPSSYALPSIVFRAWQVWYLVVGVVSALLVLATCRIGLRWLGFVLFYLFYYVISTIVAGSNGGLASACIQAMRGIGFVSLLEYSLTRNRREAVLAFIIAGVVMCTANYATYLLYRDVTGGMRHGYIEYYQTSATTQHWFLFSHDNGTAFFYIPVIVTLWYYAALYRSRAVEILAIVFSAATIYMYIDLWSVTAMLVTVVTVVAMVVLLHPNFEKRLGGVRLRLVFCLCTLIALLIVLFSMSDIVQNAAAYFGKTRTLNIRASIWEKSIDWFLSCPLFGNGYEENYTTYLKIGINHSHNFVLDILYSGGVCAAVTFLIGYMGCEQADAVHTPRRGTAMLLFGIAACFVLGCFDWYAYMVAPLALPYFYFFAGSSEDGADAYGTVQEVPS